MRTEVIIPLMHGVWRDGRWHGRAALRPINGADEALVMEAALPVRRATALLAATTLAIGDIAPVTPEIANGLTIGDRERLLLALHAISFGAKIDVVAHCADPACGERIELPVTLSDLFGVETDTPPPAEHALIAASGALHVRFRLPTGADHEAAARLANDLERAADRMLTRCILGVTDEHGRAVPADDVLDALRAPLADAFRTLDPAAETVAAFDCPACGRHARASLDALTLLGAELARTESIFADVNRLARAYHWSEADILALPVARRRRYLALLAQSGAGA
jgi:hypothetical protein